MLSPEQESYREELANLFGGACVLPLPGHSTVAICGWSYLPADNYPDDDTHGFRADGAQWEWLHEDGSHGPVDGVHPLRELLAEARPYIAEAAKPLEQVVRAGYWATSRQAYEHACRARETSPRRGREC